MLQGGGGTKSLWNYLQTRPPSDAMLTNLQQKMLGYSVEKGQLNKTDSKLATFQEAELPVLVIWANGDKFTDVTS